MAAAEPARGRRCGRAATRRGPGNCTSPPTRSPPGGPRPTACCCPTTRSSACTASPTASPSTRSGTSPAPRRATTRCWPLSRTSTCTASRWSSRPTWCWPCSLRRTRSPPSRRSGTSSTTRRSPSGTPRCPRAAQAVLAAETGHLDLAHDYLAESALMDLADLEHNTRDGLHLAALAGSWIGLVAGFGGMRCRVGALPTFAPRLPPALTRLTFAVMLRGRRLRIRVLPGEAGYMLDDEDEGPPLVIQHYGQPVSVTGGEPQTRPIPDQPVRERPAQPPAGSRSAATWSGSAAGRRGTGPGSAGNPPPAADSTRPGEQPAAHRPDRRGHRPVPARAARWCRPITPVLVSPRPLRTLLPISGVLRLARWPGLSQAVSREQADRYTPGGMARWDVLPRPRHRDGSWLAWLGRPLRRPR